jgi:hypothetical protein
MSFSSISYNLERTRNNMTRIAELRTRHNNVHTDDPVTYVANTNEPRRNAIGGSQVHALLLQGEYQPQFYAPAGRSAINGNVTWGNGSWNAERLVRLSIEEEEDRLEDRFRNMPGFGIPPSVRAPDLSPVVMIERIRPCSADGARAFHYIDRPVRAIEMGEPESCLPYFLVMYQWKVVCSVKLRWLVVAELWGEFLTRDQLQTIRRDMARIAHKIFQYVSSIRTIDPLSLSRGSSMLWRSECKFKKMLRRLVFPMLGQGDKHAREEAFNEEYDKQVARADRLDLEVD